MYRCLASVFNHSLYIIHDYANKINGKRKTENLACRMHAWKGSIEWPLPLRRGSRARGGVYQIAPPRVGGILRRCLYLRSEMKRICHLLGLIIFTITTLNSSIKGMTVFRTLIFIVHRLHPACCSMNCSEPGARMLSRETS